MTSRRRAIAGILAAFLLAAGLGSCARKLGWGVVLWSSSEGPLPAGSVVPVYIRSNIQSLYVVGVPGSDKKVELPLWQVETFPSKSKAKARVEAFGGNLSLYLSTSLDGLPVRQEPNNLAKRVYRLREGESVKVLRKVEGERVSTAGEALSGDWYEVLAEGGEVGYVFSHAMRLYDEAKEGPPAASATASAAPAARVDLVFTRSWKPAYFQEMIDDERIDLDYFSLRFGLFSDTVRRQIRIELPGVSKVFEYSAISEEGGALVFADTPLRIKAVGDRRLDISWIESAAEPETAPAPSAAAPASAAGAAAKAAQAVQGFPGRASFVLLSNDPREVVRLEELRQQKLLEAFVAENGGSWLAEAQAEEPAPGAAAGETPSATPASPATPASGAAPAAARSLLSISKSRRFTWSGREALPPGFLPPGIGDTGDAVFRLHLDPALASAWNGAFSLRFDIPVQGGQAAATAQARVDLLYKKTPEGLLLARALLGEGLEGPGGDPGIVATGADPRIEPVQLRRKD